MKEKTVQELTREAAEDLFLASVPILATLLMTISARAEGVIKARKKEREADATAQ